MPEYKLVAPYAGSEAVERGFYAESRRISGSWRGGGCDVPKALAFHDEKGTEHRFLWEASASGSCSGQCKFQCPKEFVIECSGTLGCEQCHILNDFLSVDSGQLLSVWFCLNLILPLRRSAFYTI